MVNTFGQVALLDADERLLAMFVAFRGQVAAWMPDGTRLGPCHGPSPLIDGPATPGAAERIGRVLKEASDAAGPPAGAARIERGGPRDKSRRIADCRVANCGHRRANDR